MEHNWCVPTGMIHRSLTEATSRRADYITGWEENVVVKHNLFNWHLHYVPFKYILEGRGICQHLSTVYLCSTNQLFRDQVDFRVVLLFRAGFGYTLFFQHANVSIPAIDHHFPIIATWEAHMVSRLHFWSLPVHSCLLNECLWFVSLSLEL